MKALVLQKIFLAVCLFFAANSIAADSQASENDDQAKLEQQLQAIEAEINKFKTMLDKTQGEKTNLEKNLESNEKEINKLLQKIQSIQTDLDKGKDKLSRLSDKQQQLLEAKNTQQTYIAQQIRAAYQMGNQEYLKVLLNQEEPNQISRMLTYYKLFNRARAKQVADYSQTIAQLDNVAALINEENKLLASNQQKLIEERAKVVSVQLQKRKVLVALKREIAATGKQMQTRLADRKRLEQLIARIQKGISNLPTPEDIVPFKSLKGQLVLPVAGIISHHYGNQRNAGKLRWNGVVIDAKAGDPVLAVHYGRVVFSDWLRGFGMLMIINHGEGYMSLYGYNQVLYQQPGDWVRAGETIATVGDSGGQNRAGLYFEIRVAGKTADPQLWCKARTQRAA